MYHYKNIIVLALIMLVSQKMLAQADPGTYLNPVKEELTKQWPKNRAINLVFHGHSVPSGYFRTPDVRTLEAYPQQVLQELKAAYPYAVINVIVTAIGGENSIQGEKRFDDDVLIHKPDVLFIDYALNDRTPGLEKAKEATEKMIQRALKKNIKVILLTPSTDLKVNILTSGNELEQFANQITALAKQYNIGLADSYSSFKDHAAKGEDLKIYMSQSNHPNKDGHRLIAQEVVKYFK
jgi:lysophospholipase L1-like esterase